MSKNIKGITLTIEGDSKPFQKALKDVDKASSNTAKELSQINRALKFDEGNTTLLSQKFEVLQDAINQTSTRLDALKQAQAEVDRQFANGEIDATAYREFKREIEITQGKLEAFKKQADTVQAKIDVKADTSGIDKMKSELKSLGSEAKQVGKEIGDSIASGAAVGVAALGGLAVAGQETAGDLAKMNAVLANTGFDNSSGAIDKILQESVAITGEMDSAVEAINNLANVDMDQSQLAQTMEHLTGAAIQFSDTLKLEGLADGLQETLATGEAIGSFGEYLERSGMNLDTFNDGLAKAKKNGTEMDFVLETLSNTGAKSFLDSYKEMNGALYENQLAQAELELQTGKFAETLAPVTSAVMGFVASIIEWMNNNPELARTITIVVGAIAGIAGAIALLAPVINGIMTLMPLLGTAFGAISAPIAIAVGAVVGFIALAALIFKNWEPISEFFKSLWEGIKQVFMSVISSISDFLSSAYENVKNITFNVWNGIKDFFSKWGDELLTFFTTGLFGVLVKLVVNNWDKIKQVTSQVFSNIKEFLSNIISNIVDGAVNKFNNFRDGIVKTFQNIKDKISSIWSGLKDVIKKPINSVIGLINQFIRGINKLKVPDWVPSVGGKGINIPEIPMLAKGTNYFKGGMAIVGEKGPELVEMPTGAKVHPNDRTQQMLGGDININVASLVVREEADIKKIAKELYNLQQSKNRGGGRW
ncbi:phage-related minor tail protein [Ureibacillus xyleni]|uniref:Phage-related minor tail protein n=1 Tax=Ureibacillus xyleni TaxID=614648 RepID=A0A285SWS3_9BACL|nr:hypothetical protein [Ureibacillus xyleni]SOC12797.1 phage-related minor tail protein [Ureibacillus xyleni]